MGKRSDKKKAKLISLLQEYLKDSNRSDKEIAKALGVSQPTASKMKARLLEEGFIRQFTAIPDFAKMGFEILAISFVKFNTERLREMEASSEGWAHSQSGIIFSSRAEGMGFDAVTLSLHRNYAEYDKFLNYHKRFGHFVIEAKHVIVDLVGGIVKPFSFKYLTEEMEKSQD
jgi:DNA-binding Lrp family transcriptional regulator